MKIGPSAMRLGVWVAFTMFALPATGGAAAMPLPAFDRLTATWAQLRDYSVTIDAHEVLDGRTSDHELRYAFRKPDRARMDVISGSNHGTTVLWSGGEDAVGYHRGLSLFKKHGTTKDVLLTSLRGNGVLTPDLGDIIACFGDHRADLVQRDGPLIGTEATDEIELPYTNVICRDDSTTDRSITRDVVDVSKRTGLVLRRERFEGTVEVERWALRDYVLNTGLGDGTFR